MIANVALPVFIPHFLLCLLALFFIAALEALFLKRSLKLPYPESYSNALSANLRSTVVGIPVAWIWWLAGAIPVQFVVGFFKLEVHPVIRESYQNSIVTGGMIPTAWSNVAAAAGWLISLIPFWLASVWFERKFIWKKLPEHDPKLISQAVVRGNLASYGIFLMVGLFALATAVQELPERREELKKRELKLEEIRERR